MTTAPTKSPLSPAAAPVVRAEPAHPGAGGAQPGARHQPVAGFHAPASSPRPTLLQGLQRLPRAIRWAIYGGGLVLLLVIYSDYVLAAAAEWNAAAQERIDALHNAYTISHSDLRVESQLGNVIEAQGPVEAPAGEAETSAALNRAINEVLKKYLSVTKENFRPASPGKLKRGTMTDILNGGEARYVAGTLEFEATVEHAMKIIAELEARPEIEAISSLRLNRPSGKDALRKINVRMQLEAWVIDASPARGSMR